MKIRKNLLYTYKLSDSPSLYYIEKIEADGRITLKCMSFSITCFTHKKWMKHEYRLANDVDIKKLLSDNLYHDLIRNYIEFL